jgi:hypothetical protein
MEPMITYSAAAFTAFAALASPQTGTSKLVFEQRIVSSSDGQCASWVGEGITKVEKWGSVATSVDADPLQPKTVRQLVSLLASAPHRGTGASGIIVPAADGSIQAEWHLEEATIGLLVEDDGRQSTWIRFDNGQHVEEFGLAAVQFFHSLVIQNRLNV